MFNRCVNALVQNICYIDKQIQICLCLQTVLLVPVCFFVSVSWSQDSALWGCSPKASPRTRIAWAPCTVNSGSCTTQAPCQRKDGWSMRTSSDVIGLFNCQCLRIITWDALAVDKPSREKNPPQKTYPPQQTQLETVCANNVPKLFLRASCLISRREGGQFARTALKIVYPNSFFCWGECFGWWIFVS